MSHRCRVRCLATVCSPFTMRTGKEELMEVQWKKRRDGYIINRTPEFMVKLFGENGTAWTVLFWLKDSHRNFKDPRSPLFIYFYCWQKRNLERNEFNNGLNCLIWPSWIEFLELPIPLAVSVGTVQCPHCWASWGFWPGLRCCRNGTHLPAPAETPFPGWLHWGVLFPLTVILFKSRHLWSTWFYQVLCFYRFKIKLLVYCKLTDKDLLMQSFPLFPIKWVCCILY